MNELDEQNLKYWKAGLIYINPNDPDIWVKKRIGIGWTLNFAHSKSYYILGAFLLIAVVIVVIAINLDKGQSPDR